MGFGSKPKPIAISDCASGFRLRRRSAVNRGKVCRMACLPMARSHIFRFRPLPFESKAFRLRWADKAEGAGS
jgi:hypothetical protein